MYLDHRPTEKHCLNNLRPFWAKLNVTDVTTKKCKEYAEHRPPVAARRDLEVLRAAIRHWNKEVKPLASVPTIWLPDKPASRTRFLTRSDVAKLLLGARGWKLDKGTERWTRVAEPVQHLARFIIVAFYTGTRSGAILETEWSWVNLERAVMLRRAPGEIDSKTKRRPPLKIGRRLLSHLKRWKKMDGKLTHVIHYEGAPVQKLRRSWETACERAGVEASAHDLRRTRATILMSKAKSDEMVEVIGQSLGMTPRVLREIYAQYDPEWQSEVADVDR
jgi:integrase